MEEEWEILELTGPYSTCAVHTPTGGLLYSLGTVIVVWDVLTDKKINLRCHSSPVTSLCFSTDNEFFVSAELSHQPLICLWRWRNLEQISAKWLPFKPRASNISAIFTSFSHKKVLVCEVETDGGYRITLWDIVEGQLKLKAVEELELNEYCLGVAILNDLLQFACLEPNCLKLWSIDSCTVNKRFHFKTPVKLFDYCRSQSIFALLLQNNSVLLLNQSGKTLALLSNPSYSFTSLISSSDYLYVSSKEGSVIIYNLRNYGVFKELPQTHSCPIEMIKVNSGTMIYVVFEDSTVQILNLAEGQVSNQSSGHSLPLTSAAWADRLHFFSSSQEGCLYVWKYVGKGWNMQAMDVSAGKGNISSLAVHPSHRLLAVGFQKGSIKIFQTGEKPKFLNLLQFDNSSVSEMSYSHCGQYLTVLHESGACFILNSKHEVVAELEHTRSRPVLLICTHQLYSSQGLHLMAATCKEEYLISLQVFKCAKDQLEKLDEKSMEIEGICTGLCFHPSGYYILAASDAGGIYIFHAENGDVAGVILTEKSIIGCLVDPSGLYVGVFAESALGWHNRLTVYEIGTGKKASELGRLDNIHPPASKWSYDGKYLLLGGLSGLLTVWRLPKVLISTIHDMLASMQSNPFIWQEYPIDLQNKQIQGPKATKKVKEVIVMPEDHKKERGAFVDSVVVLVNRPEKVRERTTSKQTRVSRINVPEDSFSKTGSRSETPVSVHKDYRPTIKQNVNDFYHKKRETFNKPPVRQSPIVVKSTLVGSSKSVESIDVECHGVSHNPAHRLYEKFESGRSDDLDSRY